MQRRKLEFLFLNVGHFLDHFFVLIFATASLRLTSEWGMSYSELIPYGTLGFVAFGIGAIPAGWLADKWSREGMMVVFFVGMGSCSILASTANTPLELAIFLTLIGLFAAIYHPVGLAMVVQGREKTGVPLAINGIFGNMGVASAALFTGVLVDASGWRSAFVVPGAISIALGALYLLFIRRGGKGIANVAAEPSQSAQSTRLPNHLLIRTFGIILFTTAVGGLIFQSTTFALPKVLDERLGGVAGTATLAGSYAFLVFSVAAVSQLVVGYLVDRRSARTVLATIALLQAVFFFAMTHLQGIAALFVAAAFMLAVFGQIPVNDVLVGRIAHSDWRSRAYALRYVVTFSVMASALPMIAWIHGVWGFDTLFRVLAVAALAVLAAALFLPGEKRPIATARRSVTRLSG